MAELSDQDHADLNIVDAVMATFTSSVKAGEVVWLSEDGVRVGAIVPLDVVEAGLAALGRSE